jgi:hypothetical protein
VSRPAQPVIQLFFSHPPVTAAPAATDYRVRWQAAPEATAWYPGVTLLAPTDGAYLWRPQRMSSRDGQPHRLISGDTVHVFYMNASRLQGIHCSDIDG